MRMTSPAASLTATLAESFSAADDETIGLQLQLAQIPAPTGAEGRRGDWVADAFARAGCQSRRDAVGNVLASLPDEKAGPPVVVCAHLDTVFADTVCHQVTSERGRFTGPGIGDNARGLAGMLAMARFLVSHRLPTRRPILFAATVGEEGQGNLAGARHLFATSAADAAAAIALDGAGDERIVTHAVGVQRFRVTYRGPGGHSWAASDAPNPLHAASHFASGISRLRLPQGARTTLAVTTMHGGTAVNAIPGDAVVEVDARSLSADALHIIRRELETLAHHCTREENERRGPQYPPLAVGIELTSDRPAGVADPDSLLVRSALGATAAIGRTPEFAMASTDANIPLSLGIPAVTLGAGGCGGDTHTTHEWFENRDGALGLARALATILLTAGLP